VKLEPLDTGTIPFLQNLWHTQEFRKHLLGVLWEVEMHSFAAPVCVGHMPQWLGRLLNHLTPQHRLELLKEGIALRRRARADPWCAIAYARWGYVAHQSMSYYMIPGSPKCAQTRYLMPIARCVIEEETIKLGQVLQPFLRAARVSYDAETIALITTLIGNRFIRHTASCKKCYTSFVRFCKR